MNWEEWGGGVFEAGEALNLVEFLFVLDKGPVPVIN